MTQKAKTTIKRLTARERVEAMVTQEDAAERPAVAEPAAAELVQRLRDVGLVPCAHVHNGEYQVGVYADVRQGRRGFNEPGCNDAMQALSDWMRDKDRYDAIAIEILTS